MIPDGAPVHNRGPVQQISGGRWVYPLDMRPEDIHIEDIAASLSKLCRYIGHTIGSGSYSVAQHSVIVSRIVPDEHRLWALLHDGSEAFIGPFDVARPTKKCLAILAGFDVVRLLEEPVQRAIAKRFRLPWPMPACIHEADLVVAATERRDVLHPSALDWGPMPAPLPTRIIPMRPAVARCAFMLRFRKLMRERGK